MFLPHSRLKCRGVKSPSPWSRKFRCHDFPQCLRCTVKSVSLDLASFFWILGVPVVGRSPNRTWTASLQSYQPSSSPQRLKPESQSVCLFVCLLQCRGPGLRHAVSHFGPASQVVVVCVRETSAFNLTFQNACHESGKTESCVKLYQGKSDGHRLTGQRLTGHRLTGHSCRSVLLVSVSCSK